MNPILFYSSETSFDTNGLGILPDAISCKVTEERNGAYELVMEYPLTGLHYDLIAPRSILLVKPNPYADPQPFRIYRLTKPLSGRVSIFAAHITYDLSGVPVSPFTAASATGAMSALKTHAAIDNPFSFWTDKSTVASMEVDVPASIRSLLGGTEGSVLDVYGGEYEWDFWDVKLWNQRGRDSGVTVRYGKNLTDIQQDENISNVATGVYPYWADSEGNLVQLPEKVIDAPGNYDYNKIIPLDLSGDFEDAPTINQLREKAQAYMEKNQIGIPAVSIDVSFQPLEQTEEYKDIVLLEKVNLCDTVSVIYPALGVSATAKCVKTVYDVLKDRYESISLGNAKTNIADTIINQRKEIEELPHSSYLVNAINNASNWITGAKGGNVLFQKNVSDQPYEILIMDKPDIETAAKIWRWNSGGLGHSKNGYNGPYGTAITQDGAIVADFITAGTMSANIIKSGRLEGLNNTAVYFDLDAGEISASKLVSAQYPRFIASIGPSEQSDSFGAINVYDTNYGNLFSTYIAGSGSNRTAIWTSPMQTNAAKTNRKGISIWPDNIQLFADYNGTPRGIQVKSDTGDINVNSTDLNITGTNINIKSSSQTKITGQTYFDGRLYIGSDANYRWLEAYGNGALMLVAGGGLWVSMGRTTVAVFEGAKISAYVDLDMGGNSILNQSDARLKENIHATQIDALPLLNALELKKYDWVETGEHQDIGFIAQQMQTVIPELVHDGGEDGLSIKPLELIPYLTKAIQELSVKVEMLEARVNQLQNAPQPAAARMVDAPHWSDPYTREEKKEFTAQMTAKRITTLEMEPGKERYKGGSKCS